MNRTVLIGTVLILVAAGAGVWWFTQQNALKVADVEATDNEKGKGEGGGEKPLQAPQENREAQKTAKLSVDERLKKIKEWAADKTSKEAKQNLLSMLKIEKHEKVRAELIRSLGVNWRSDPEVIPELTRCRMVDESDLVREATEEVLRDLGRDGQEAVPALKKMLQEDQHRVGALKSLGEIGPFANLAIKDVAAYLTSKRVVERREALRALKKIGASSVAVLGNAKIGIMSCLSDKDPEVRAEAAKVLKRIGPITERPEVKEALATLRKDSDERVKRAADAAWAKWNEG